MKSIRRAIALGSALALAAGCDRLSQPVETNELLPDSNPRWADVGLACSADAPAVPLTGEQLATLPAPSPGNADDLLAQESRDVPGGWGGMFVRDGVVMVYLVDPSKLPEAVAAMTGSSFMPRTPQVALKGRWTFAELNDWKNYLSVHQALTGVNAITVDLDETENRLLVGVADESSRALLEAKLRALDAPCWLMAIRIQLPITDL